uniref:Putative secreted protein n=1 Tax=Anopheles darlingi TaxID=43151 RepID=A0A2M4DF78_ANODA
MSAQALINCSFCVLSFANLADSCCRSMSSWRISICSRKGAIPRSSSPFSVNRFALSTKGRTCSGTFASIYFTIDCRSL